MGRKWIAAMVAAHLAFAILGTASAADLGGRPFIPPGDALAMPDSWTGKRVARPAEADLSLAIDQQLYPALLPLIQNFARVNGIKVALQEGTCGVAAGALADKTADITGMCCPPGPLDRMPGVRYHTIGIAAIALIVHPSNPVGDVGFDEARAMFGGKTRSWSDLPVSGVKVGPTSEIRAVTRLHCKSRPGHWRLLLDNENLFSIDMHEVPAIRDMIAEIGASRAAIGYETLWHVAANESAGKVKQLRLSGIDPADGAALAAGRYPLYRVMNITSWQGPDANPMADKLVAWLVAKASEIDASYGIVPAVELRRHGWRFIGDELVGEPR
jgi:phosphate transport system substrate-binding protein